MVGAGVAEGSVANDLQSSRKGSSASRDKQGRGAGAPAQVRVCEGRRHEQLSCQPDKAAQKAAREAQRKGCVWVPVGTGTAGTGDYSGYVRAGGEVGTSCRGRFDEKRLPSSQQWWELWRWQ